MRKPRSLPQAEPPTPELLPNSKLRLRGGAHGGAMLPARTITVPGAHVTQATEVPNRTETMEEYLGPLQSYLASLPRRVRIFNERLEVIWRNRPDGTAIAPAEALPPEGLERDRWPVSRVLRGMPRAVRLYSVPASSDGRTPGYYWRVSAWPLKTPHGLMVAEETDRLDSTLEDADRIRQLDQDIEDLLHNVMFYLQHGSDSKSLRLPNPFLPANSEVEAAMCFNHECPGHGTPPPERCWEIARPLREGLSSAAELHSRIQMCSDCSVFGVASPNPMIRIAENFNRLISLLQVKYQETLEVQLRMQQADKLAVMGELLATIAHEIKNPLGIIMGRLDIIGLETESMSPELTEDLGTIYQQVHRMRQIIDHLLRMARPAPPAFAPVNLNTVIMDCLEMIGKTLSNKQINVLTELDPDLPTIQADHIQMQQVLLNLILNARDAMEDGGGHLTITSALEPREAPGVSVSVADTGEGIAPDQLGKLFSSFHTTKVNRGGTGLGLVVCRRIMRSHSGSITVESELKKGTTMRLWIPIARR